jgi:hypothetical protein
MKEGSEGRKCIRQFRVSKFNDRGSVHENSLRLFIRIFVPWRRKEGRKEMKKRGWKEEVEGRKEGREGGREGGS